MRRTGNSISLPAIGTKVSATLNGVLVVCAAVPGSAQPAQRAQAERGGGFDHRAAFHGGSPSVFGSCAASSRILHAQSSREASAAAIELCPRQVKTMSRQASGIENAPARARGLARPVRAGPQATAYRATAPWPTARRRRRSGCHSRPGPRPEKRRAHRVQADRPVRRRARSAQPGPGAPGRRIVIVVPASMPAMPVAMSISSGITSCAGTGSALAGEPSSGPASGLKYQLSSTRRRRARHVRRCGRRGMKALRRLGCMPERRRAAALGQLVGQGAGRVDQRAATHAAAVSQRDLPIAGCPRRCLASPWRRTTVCRPGA